MDRKILSVFDKADIENTIKDVEQILHTFPFNENKAREKINEVNGNHPENVAIYNIFFSVPRGTKITLADANYTQLISDLEWKHYYLNAKLFGKTIDDMQKEINREKSK